MPCMAMVSADKVAGEGSLFSHLLQRTSHSHSTWSALVHVADAHHRTLESHGGLAHVLAIGAVMIKRMRPANTSWAEADPRR